MSLKRIDAFDINYVDSCARKEFKLKDSSGTGERRIYVGHDETKYDEFFDFNAVEYFFTNKEDLINYLEEAKNEFFSPTQEYKENISDMYESLVADVNTIETKILKYTFKKTFDIQKRYYLVLEPQDGENSKSYQYIRNILLPRVTKICFIKFQDDVSRKFYIYAKPIFFNSLKIKDEIANDTSVVETQEKEAKIRYRKRQTEYRQKLLEQMPFCPFTNVTDDRILVACHIKPFKNCENDDERYDHKNGITMTPTYHALFDIGFISFNEDGRLLVSPFLSNINKSRLNLKEGAAYRLQTGSAEYLKYHREKIFCKISDINLEE